LDFNARSGRSDERVAGRRRCIGRGAIADRLVERSALHARGFIQEIDRAFIGRHPQPSMPFRETDKPFAIRNPPPTLGEHNREYSPAFSGCPVPRLINWRVTALSEPRC